METMNTCGIELKNKMIMNKCTTYLFFYRYLHITVNTSI